MGNMWRTAQKLGNASRPLFSALDLMKWAAIGPFSVGFGSFLATCLGMDISILLAAVAFFTSVWAVFFTAHLVLIQTLAAGPLKYGRLIARARRKVRKLGVLSFATMVFCVGGEAFGAVVHVVGQRISISIELKPSPKPGDGSSKNDSNSKIGLTPTDIPEVPTMEVPQVAPPATPVLQIPGFTG